MVIWMLNCLHAEGKTGAEQINMIWMGKGKRSPEKNFLPFYFIFFFTAAPWINVVLAAKPRAGVINFETCLTCLPDALSVPQHGRKHWGFLQFLQEVPCVDAVHLSAVPSIKASALPFSAAFKPVPQA